LNYARSLLLALCIGAASQASAQVEERVVDIPSRAGVMQRILLVSAPDPKAAVILFAGGDGGLQIAPDGAMAWGKGNFLVRMRESFATKSLQVAVIDAPSDRQRYPFLGGFRQTPEHAADVKAVIAWLRAQSKLPVWLVGTSRGTQSAAFVATSLDRGDGPDGLVLTSSVLRDPRSRAVPAMPLDKLRIPVLVVHHELDDCKVCAFRDIGGLMEKLDAVPVKALLTFKGGRSVGDPCEAFAYHGYNGIEEEVVGKIAAWIVANGSMPAKQ
jgi:hypothetical protein